MMAAAHGSLRVGAHEYESALAVIDAGTRKAAGFLTVLGWGRFVSPMIQGLQIMQSGRDTSMVHRRASVKTYEKAGPRLFLFFTIWRSSSNTNLALIACFHVADVTDDAAKVQMAVFDAQQAAIKPGVKPEDIAAAANEV